MQCCYYQRLLERVDHGQHVLKRRGTRSYSGLDARNSVRTLSRARSSWVQRVLSLALSWFAYTSHFVSMSVIRFSAFLTSPAFANAKLSAVMVRNLLKSPSGAFAFVVVAVTLFAVAANAYDEAKVQELTIRAIATSCFFKMNPFVEHRRRAVMISLES